MLSGVIRGQNTAHAVKVLELTMQTANADSKLTCVRWAARVAPTITWHGHLSRCKYNLMRLLLDMLSTSLPQHVSHPRYVSSI